MDGEEYRKRYAEQIQRAADQSKGSKDYLDKSMAPEKRKAAIPSAMRGPDEVAQALNLIRDGREDADLRASTLQHISIAVSKSQDLIDEVIGLLKDASQPSALRLAALKVLRQSSFRSAIFDAKRAEYLEALRSIVDDPETTLREQALEVLAQEKDEYAQRRLLAGLQDVSQALLPPHKAIQLLGYDVHAEHYPVLREMVKNPVSPEAKQEAVRLLATDSGSKQMLAGILTNKNESEEVRRLSAAALQSLAPEEFERHAKEIVLDESEGDNLRAACLSALTHFAKGLSADTAFNTRMQQLKTQSRSKAMAAHAARYIDKETKK